MRFRRFIACSVVVLSLVATGTWRTSAQGTQPGRDTSAASVSQYKLADKMPLDPEAVVGKLPNGLTYYVRPNPKPTHRVELRLVVKAGSALEDDDQQGLAHFVEHMLFEGTKHFPGKGIEDFLTSMGLSIGADANADTSFDETEYQIGVPTDVPGVLDHALLVLEDWAGGALFEQSGIEHERGIVLSEWRLHLGAGERTEDKIRRAQLDGSRYADRPPIGKPEIIQNAKRDELVRFYRDWYRPDLMAVIVVGDVNRDAVVTMIKSHFSSLVSPSPVRPRPTFDVPEHPGTRYAILPDQEMTRTVVSLSNLRPARDQGSVGGYRAIMLDQLFGAMLSDRLNELSQSANPPFLQAQADRSLFPMPRTKDDAVAQALVSDNGVLRGLDAIETELQRVTRFGFTATEFDRARNAMMRSYERVTTESPDRESSSRADEYTRNFLEDEALPTIWQELAFHRRFLPDVTLAELNALASRLVPRAKPPRHRVRAPKRERDAAHAGAARRRGRVCRGQTARRLRRCGRRTRVDGHGTGRRHDRQDRRARVGHHRVDAFERGQSRDEADDAQGGSDPLPGVRARRNVARERRGLRSGARRRRRRERGRCRRVHRGRAWQGDERQSRRRAAVHR